MSNARIRQEAAAKDAALATAQQAVDQMLMRVANERLSEMPLAHPLREALLQDALNFYEGFLAQPRADARIKESAATILHSLGCLQRELGQWDQACRSFERSAELLGSIVDADPRPPALREKLVAAQEALAYSWQVNPSDSDGSRADEHYRRTLEMYRALERDWPERRQPTNLCLRRFAELSFRRGKLQQAEQCWRESIAVGEAYLLQHPENVDARATLCWSTVGLAEAVLMPAPNRAAEAEPILKKGLQHATAILDSNPRSSQARQVATFLNCHLGRCYCSAAKTEEAVAHFRQSVGEIESLCAEFPWNRPYWDNAIYIHDEAVCALQNAGQDVSAATFARAMVAWTYRVTAKIPDDPEPRADLARCRKAAEELVRHFGVDASQQTEQHQTIGQR